MRTLPVSSVGVKFSNSFRAAEAEEKKADAPVTSPANPEKKTNISQLVTAAVAVAALGVSAYTLKGRGNSQTIKETKKIAEEAKEEAKKATEEAAKKAEEKVNELKGTVDDLTTTVSNNEATRAEKQQWNEGYLDGLNKKVETLEHGPVTIQATQTRFLRDIDGFHLIKNPETLKEDVINKIKGAADKFIYGGTVIPALSAGAVVWLPTAETLPEKEGGLGEVPVQMARNMSEELGIENYLVRPLMEVPGKSTLIEKNGKYKYWYAKMKNPKGIDVNKIVDFNVNVVRNGQQETHNVEVFTGVDEQGCNRIMFRCPAYFQAEGLYKNTTTASEQERYNFFSKLVYEFAKLKSDPKSHTSYRIYDEKAFKAVKAPDTMVLNDWHTGPIAALMRLMAPAEASDGALDGKVAETFENMNLLYLAHNLEYQGWGKEYSSDMLNTLFDKYAYEIYEYAQTGFTETYEDENNIKREVPIYSLKSALVTDGTVNMANMAMAYATTIKPVSPTYASEIATETERGKALTHIAHERLFPQQKKYGNQIVQTKKTMHGQSNGWDKSVNEFSEKNISGFAKEKLNEDKYGIFKYNIDNIKGLTLEQQKDVNKIMQEEINQRTFENISLKLLQLGIPQVTEIINKFTAEGLFNLRSFEPVTSDMPIDEIMKNRRHNKHQYFDTISEMIKFNKENNNNKLFPFNVYEYTDLSDITHDNLDQIPIFNMGVRFVSQKGVAIAAKAWESILNEWDQLYPGRPRPIVLIGGEDGEKGIHSRTIDETKRRLKEKGNHLLHLDGFTPNPDWMGASEWTMRPSYFEPDGDKWESLYKGTPVVMTKTGGHIDSVKNGNGILTTRTMKEIRDKLKAEHTKPEEMDYKLTIEATNDYIEALKKCLNAFYGIGNGQKYQEYVDKAIHGDQSWVQKDETGKIVECPIVGHVRDLGFDLKDFPQISESVA